VDDPQKQPKRELQPLSYESPSRLQKRGMTITLCIVAAIYGVAAYFACRYPEHWLNCIIWASIIAAPIVGIQLGGENRQNWL